MGGTYRYGKKADIYYGEWKDNLKHGNEKKPEKQVGEYQGYWENGRRHGEGVFIYPNGDIYSGWWRFGEKEGTATYKSKATGMKMQGEWKDGEIQTGRWIYPNGVYYEGTFANNKPDGSGTWNFNNGNSLQGVYTQKPAVAEEEDGGEDEDGAAKKRFDLVWQADTKISDSAFKVNSVE